MDAVAEAPGMGLRRVSDGATPSQNIIARHKKGAQMSAFFLCFGLLRLKNLSYNTSTYSTATFTDSEA